MMQIQKGIPWRYEYPIDALDKQTVEPIERSISPAIIKNVTGRAININSPISWMTKLILDALAKYGVMNDPTIIVRTRSIKMLLSQAKLILFITLPSEFGLVLHEVIDNGRGR